MASQHASGSQAASLDTEHILSTDPDTTTGVFQYWVEISVLARADRVVFRLYEKINDTGDTQRKIKEWVLANEQADGMWVSPMFMLLHGWKFTLEQTDGTGRTFQWSIRKG